VRNERRIVSDLVESVRRVFAGSISALTSSPRAIIGLTVELECQNGDDEGREKDRQKTLSGASICHSLVLGGLEGLRSAGASSTANLYGVTSRFDWYLDCVIHLERSGLLSVDHDVVRATSDLDSD
jgi:hypothetical protein